MARGRLITIEGLDGSGKTTLSVSLAGELRHRGIDVAELREPGGVAASERIRALVKDPALRIDAAAEALLYAAARAQLVAEAIEPRLAEGTWVLLDRFVDSSLAYQGAGRGLGIQAVRAINALAVGDLVPDRTLLLRLDPQLGRDRLRERGEQPDRLESEADSFFDAIAQAYDSLAAAQPQRWRVLDGAATASDVLRDALEAIADLT